MNKELYDENGLWEDAGFCEAVKPFPVCNHISDVGKENIGYTQGIFSDGIPFEAELWTYGNDLNISFVFPMLWDIDKSEQKIKNGNVIGYHNRDARVQSGVLTIGMVDNGSIDDVNVLIAYVEYLKNMGAVEFTSNMENGAILLATDIEGNELVQVIITLEEGGTVIGKTSLKFRNFPNQAGKPAFRVIK